MNGKEFFEEEAKLIALDKLKVLLRKLGLRSVKRTLADGVLTPADIQIAINRMQADYGKPDVILMDPASAAALAKHLQKK